MQKDRLWYLMAIIFLILLFLSFRYWRLLDVNPLYKPGLAPKDDIVSGVTEARKRAINITRAQVSYVPANSFDLQNYYEEEHNRYLIKGKITEEEGRALSGAIVQLYKSGLSLVTFAWPKAIRTVICDGEGRYEIYLDDEFHGLLVTSHEGYSQLQEEIAILVPGTLERDYCLRTAPACVEGFIKNEKGIPISGATAFASVQGTSRGFFHSLILARSDVQGRYLIRPIPEGFVAIGVATHQHKSQMTGFDQLRAGPCKRVDFALEDAIEISFLVKNNRGEGIPHACGMNSLLGEVVFAVPEGSAPFDRKIWAAGYREKYIRIDPASPPASVTLDEGLTLTGQVVSDAGARIKGAKINVNGNTSVFSDGDGNFSVPVSSLDNIQITATKPGFIEERMTVNESAPSEIEIRLRHIEGGIFGTINASRFRMMFHAKGPDGRNASYSRELSNENGVFCVTDIPPGAYNVFIESNPYSALESNHYAWISNVEIKIGYLYGPLLIELK